MGLDIVNIVLSVEEEFDIYLPDSELENMYTPSHLAMYIHSQLIEQRDKDYNSKRGFYKLRKLLMEEFNFRKSELKPTTKLATLFPKDIRRKWRALNEVLDCRLSPLVLTKLQYIQVLVLNILISLLIYFYSDFGLALFFFFFNYVLILFVYGKFFAKGIPKAYQELASLLPLIGYSRKMDVYTSYDYILDRVIKISANELSLSISEVQPNSEYVKDLGAG